MTTDPTHQPADRPAREHLAQLLADQPLAVLATHHDGQPYCNLVAVLGCEDLDWLAFATPRNTRKYRNLLADPRVSLMLDDRRRLSEGVEAVTAATAMGTAAEPPSDERADLIEKYIRHHPTLEAFVRSEDAALLKVHVHRWVVVDRFQHVVEFSPGR